MRLGLDARFFYFFLPADEQPRPRRRSVVATVIGLSLSLALGCTHEQPAAGPERPAAANGGGNFATLKWSTYLGGATAARQRPAAPTTRNTPLDAARDVAVDSQGNVYVAGQANAGDFPITIGPAHAGDADAFIAKFSPHGQLLWSRLLGGPNHDRIYGIEVRPGNDDEIAICGRAGPDFPTQPCASCDGHVIDPTFNGDKRAGALYGPQDGWVGKVDGNGAVLWLSYFGDDSSDMVRDCDIDADGFVYAGHHGAAGATPDLGTPGAYRATSYAGTGTDTVIAKLTPDGRSVVWATYLGGTANDDAPGVRVFSDGSVYVAMDTESRDFPLLNPVDDSIGGRRDFTLTRLAADGRSLLFSTLLGGSGSTEFVGTHNIGIDAAGNAYLCAETDSQDFPGTAGFFQPANAGGVDHIFAKVKVTPPTSILAATYVGGPGQDGEMQGCAVDAAGNVVAGALSEDSGRAYPTTAAAAQTDNRGGADAAVVQVAADFKSLRYASYLGGSGEDQGRAATVSGNVLVLVGMTTSTDLPVKDAVQAQHSKSSAAQSDAFVSVFVVPQPAAPAPTGS